MSRSRLRPGAFEAVERLTARGHAELREQALHVRPHGVLRDEETRRDLVRAEVAIEKQQHLQLASAESLRNRFGDDRAVAPAFTDLVEQPPRDRSRERRLALGDAAKKRDDPLGGLALQKIAGCPAPDRPEQ